MDTLRVEAPIVAGMVRLKPEGHLSAPFEFDETGLVVSV